jgi:MFS family permease
LGIDHRHTRAVSSLWRPLRLPAFRNLLIADVASDIGAFMQGVGAAWMMVSLRAGPFYVALTQTASALPFFLLALPAGAIGDIVDRRKLILVAEIWMAGVAVLLAGVTIAGKMSPVLLLILTFALSAGDALESPAWRAVLPDLVQQENLASAAALNGIEFNLARAIGPALAGIVIALAGVGTVFLINAISFFGVIAVIARWKRHPRRRTVPRETLGGATVAAIRYVRYSPRLRTLLIRSGIVTFFASGLLALLPSVAHAMSKNPMVYGLLLGCFGVGAVAGALVMQQARAKWSAEGVISGGVFVFGICTLITSVGRLLPMALSMLIGGGAWILFVSLLNVIVLNHTPEWVRARVLAVSMLMFQGAMAIGSAVWGAVATRAGLHIALMAAGAGMVLSTSLSLFLKLPEATVDVTPWVHWRLPMVSRGNMTDDDSGPVLVSVEYDVQPEKRTQFIESIGKYERIRRRDGAYGWGIFQDLENPDRYLETFLVVSWAEHLRQHERLTLADRKTEERVHGCVRGEPKVRHLIYVDEQRKFE